MFKCLYYHIKQCLAPCINHKNIDYSEYISKVSNFLKGDTKDVLKQLEDKMNECSMRLDFEHALEYRDLINDVKTITEKQKISTINLVDRDVIGIYSTQDDISIEILYIRGGAIVQNYRTIIPLVSDISECVIEFLVQFYENEAIRPKEILINEVIDIFLLRQVIDVNVNIPQKGNNKDLVNMAIENAKFNYENNRKLYENKVVKRQENIYRLGELLGIKPPKVIEAFDNSNLFGEYPVSAMVCYKNGIKSPSDYRKYHIKSVCGANDYETMKEVVYRRYYRLLMEDKPMPDLIIMDGGQIQVNACLEIINSLNLNIPVLGLRKDNNHNTNVLWFDNKEIVLSKNDDLFLFLANIQQTVHEFAISFFRNNKVKGMFSSMLDGIKGLGPKKKEALLKKYLTIDKIKTLTISEFKEVGINEKLANEILIHLNNKDDN